MNSTTRNQDTVRPPQQALPIGDYALISDCHCAALVSRRGSLDWCCMPRFDSEPCFGRLLDWEHAGYCSIAPVEGSSFDSTRRYLDDTVVLCTRFQTETGAVYVWDLLVLTDSDEMGANRQLVRIVKGLEGQVELAVEVQPRFAFGDVKPWLRQHDRDVFTAVGGENGLVICGDMGLTLVDRYSVGAAIRVGKGERRRLSVQFSRPEALDDGPTLLPTVQQLEQCLDRTAQWWQYWSRRINTEPKHLGDARRAP